VKATTLTFFGIICFSVCARGGPVEFCGYLSVSGQSRFVLTDTESGIRSGWLSTGQSFQDYTVLKFEPNSEMLSLSHAQKVVRLPLKQAKVQDRDAMLANILREQENLLAAGQRNEESVFLSRVALYSFRRDTAPAVAEKIKNQELLVSAYEKNEAHFRDRRAAGVSTDFDVLTKTEDLLREKVVLAKLRTTENRKPNQQE